MGGATEIWRWGDDVGELAARLAAGGFLAVPTESTYGLAVDPRNEAGVEAIYRFKGRPVVKPLPVIVSEVEQLTLVGANPGAVGLAELAALWPAPLTVVVPLVEPLPASAGRRSLAVRVPGHPRLRDLLRRLSTPLTATSANPSGGEPVSDLESLIPMLTGWPATIVDGGRLVGGAPSTIVQIVEEGYRVLRVGALSTEWLRERVTRPVFSATAAEIPADESRQTP